MKRKGKDQISMYAVIMAGGQGTRLWPLSRQTKPKQFHSFVGEKSLVRETYERLLPRFKPEEIIISTTKEYVDEIKKHLPELPEENFIVEPAGRGSAPACALVTTYLMKRDPYANIVFLPSDHMIRDTKRFLETIDFGDSLVQKYHDYIITIGIKPTKPDTGLGYIQIDSQLDRRDDLVSYTVKRFIEKPNIKKAEEYLSSWGYLWNAGMFIWNAKEFMAKLEQFMPETYRGMMEIEKAIGTSEEKSVINREYNSTEKTSVDYGIMEKTNKIMVVPGDFGWSDIGSWNALLEFFSEIHDSKVITKGHHIGMEDDNCLILSNDKLIATLGLKDIVVVDSPDALLICDRKKSADLKELLDKLKIEGKHLYL